ncbi:hypothetical protein VTI74DRAFT_10345 [Chaetomium olivicolor]
MSSNATNTQAYSPCLPEQEEGEWVWVPKNTHMPPTFPAPPLQSPMYASLQPTAPTLPWISSPVASMSRSFSAQSSQASPAAIPWAPSPVTPTYSLFRNDFSSVLGGSPVESLLGDFEFDPALQDCLGNAGQSWGLLVSGEANSMDLLTNDWFSGLDPSIPAQGITLPTPSTTSPANSVYDGLDLINNSSSPLTPATPALVPSTGTTPETTTSPSQAPIQLLHCSLPSCTKTFTARAALRKHERTHRPSFPCPIAGCGKGHQDKRALNRHLCAKHPEYAQQVGTPSERSQCPYCEYQGRGDNVVRHMKRHAKKGKGVQPVTVR